MTQSADLAPAVIPSAHPAVTRPQEGQPRAVPFQFTQTDNFAPILTDLNATLLVSTYQANKLIAVRSNGAGISALVRTFDRPMGLAVLPDRMAVGSRREIWQLRNAPDIASGVEPAGTHDACFLPRSAHVTGDIGIHEIAWGPEELWIINTRFSCLCTLHPDYSFVPRWCPPFITQLAAEDRCHLNGLTLIDGQPRYVTALGTTNHRDGWRKEKAHGGVLLDVHSGDPVAAQLSMPHSPRWHNNTLWVLESGTGQLLQIDPVTGHRQPIAGLPGFARGLACLGPYAFIGLSKIRATSAMDGVPLALRRNELKCGIAVVDLRTGQTVALMEFLSAVEEIFDVQILQGIRFPEILGFQKEELSHTFIVPPDSHPCNELRPSERVAPVHDAHL